MKITLGEGWEEIKHLKHCGEGFPGPKYGDLGIYADGELVLPLGLDHYEIMFDGHPREVYPKLKKLVAAINGEEYAEEPTRLSPREKAVKLLMDTYQFDEGIAKRLMENGIASPTAFEGVIERDLVDCGFTSEEAEDIIRAVEACRADEHG